MQHLNQGRLCRTPYTVLATTFNCRLEKARRTRYRTKPSVQKPCRACHNYQTAATTISNWQKKSKTAPEPSSSIEIKQELQKRIDSSGQNLTLPSGAWQNQKTQYKILNSHIKHATTTKSKHNYLLLANSI